jgi:hypothetical protein
LDLITYSMQQSLSWEANWFSASQEIPCFLWYLKVYYRIHKCPLTCPFPDPVPTSTHPHIPPTEDPSQYYHPIYA